MPKYKSLEKPAEGGTSYASLDPNAPPPGAPAAPEAPGLATHVEGADAYLRDSTGTVVRVPKELAGRYVVEQGYLPATFEDTEKAKIAAETSVAEEFIKEAGAATVSGIGAGVRLPAMIASLAGNEEATDFVRETSPTAVRAAFAAGWDALRGNDQAAIEQWDDTLKRNRVYEELFPTARMLARGTGDVASGLLLGGPLGTWAGAGKSALGVAARSAAVAGAEGASQAALDEYRASMLENRAVDRELVISNGIIGGVLSAAAGGLVGGAGKKLSDVLEARRAKGAADDAARATPTRTRAVASTERAVAEAADELDRPAVELEQTLAEAEAKVAQAARDAGVNPNAQRAAAEAAAEAEAEAFRRMAADEVDPKTWHEAANPKGRVPAMKLAMHRKAYQGGAADELTELLDDAMTGNRELTDIIWKVEPKREQVLAKMAADGIDETKAISTALRQQEDFGASLAEMRATLEAAPNRLARSRVGKFVLTQYEQSQATAAAKLAKAETAADAFIIRDQFRREVEMIRRQVNDSAVKSTGIADREAAKLMQPWAEQKYLEAANTLFDEDTWRSMGAFQKAANGQDGAVGLIDADRVGLHKFTGVDGYDLQNRPILKADPEKIRAYLAGIDDSSLRDAQVRRLFERRKSIATTIRDGLELNASQKAAAERVITASEKALKTLEDAEKMAIRLNKQAIMNETDKLLMQGGVVMRLLGGAAKISAGDFKGAAALQFGGQEMAARQAQALKIASDGAHSRLVRGILKTLNWVSGEGSENAGALAKIERRARLGGIINEGAEKLANRMRDQNYALTPLFRPFYDDPSKTPSENRAASREALARRREVLAEVVGDPGAMSRALEAPLARAMAASPQMGTQLAEEVGQRINRLQAALPGQDLPSLLPNAPRSKAMMVSDQELRQAEAYIEATIDPQSVFDDFENGHLDYDKLRFAKEQYPEMFQAARAMALDIFRELPADIRGNMATQLDFLLDFEGQLDPTLSSDFLKRQQERLELQQQKTNAAAQAPAPRPVPKAGAASQTYTQRVAGATL